MLQLQFIILPIVIAIPLLGGTAMVIIYYKIRKPDFSVYHTHTGLGIGGWSAFSVGAFLLIILLVTMIPFQPKYWILTEHKGTIATLSNRFTNGTGDITDSTYTLTLKGENVPLVVSDSRITGLKTGQRIDLTCSLAWVYGGADETDCYLRGFGS